MHCIVQCFLANWSGIELFMLLCDSRGKMVISAEGSDCMVIVREVWVRGKTNRSGVQHFVATKVFFDLKNLFNHI